MLQAANGQLLLPPGELVYARATDLSCLIKNVYNALYTVKGKEGTLLTMSARNEEKDTLIASGHFRGHTKIKIIRCLFRRWNSHDGHCCTTIQRTPEWKCQR